MQKVNGIAYLSEDFKDFNFLDPVDFVFVLHLLLVFLLNEVAEIAPISILLVYLQFLVFPSNLYIVNADEVWMLYVLYDFSLCDGSIGNLLIRHQLHILFFNDQLAPRPGVPHQMGVPIGAIT